MKLTYKTEIKVFLDGQYVGNILQVPTGGYQYSPKDSNLKGAIFATLGECKKSLEG